jgi:hypothetical protein
MYYSAGPPYGIYVAYAESKDGKRWRQPNLGLVSLEGSKKNSLILDDKMWPPSGSQAFAPFRDANPDCAPDARYKALNIKEGRRPPAGLSKTELREWKAGWKNSLYALKSPDGLRWTPMQKGPVITKGSFDSLNVAFWDSHRGRYVCFFREMIDLKGRIDRCTTNRHRVIKTSTSTDFLHWSRATFLDYGRGAPVDHTYMSSIVAMPGAPHILVGFPQRFIPFREAEPGFPHPDSGQPYVSQDGRSVQVSDTGFMTSRDGMNWCRWPQALLRPGLQAERWVHPHNNNAVAWGILETKSDIPGTPDEWSIYSHENDHRNPKIGALRRFSIRRHGFVSVHAGATARQFYCRPLKGCDRPAAAPRTWRGGELVTRPLAFTGRNLVINYSTSAAGIVLAEIQDEKGRPIPGFRLADSMKIWGDHVDRVVAWKRGSDVSGLAGRPVRLRFLLNDADLYSIQFRDES